jgi:hypothetical protein
VDKKRLLELAGIPLTERSDVDYKKAVQKAADALAYAYNETYPDDSDQDINEIQRLKNLKDIANAAYHLASDKLEL